MHRARELAKHQILAVQFELRVRSSRLWRELHIAIEPAADVGAEKMVQVGKVADVQLNLSAAVGEARLHGPVARDLRALPFAALDLGVQPASGPACQGRGKLEG